MTPGVRKVTPIPIIATVPPETVMGNGIRVPATVNLSGYPEYGNWYMSRVVDFPYLVGYGGAGEAVCIEWPGVGHGMGYVYGTVTPSSTRRFSRYYMKDKQSQHSRVNKKKSG